MMRVHAHTKFCFLCVLTLLFHQCTHCHETDHHHHYHHNDGHDHDHDHDHDHIHDDHQISKTPYTGQTNHSAPENEGAAAEHEQQYYILQLFQRYGHQDRLDFRGFQNLLLSLGLGEVRVVELEHDDLGHDHVAHLDLLEVQEGKHSHSAGHAHAHVKHLHHSHQHSHDNNGSLCSPKPAIENGSNKRSGHDHDHDHDHGHDHDNDHGHVHDQDNNHDHDHVHDHDNDHDHVHDHDNDHHDHVHDHEQVKTQAQIVKNDQKHNHKQSHDHDHNHKHDQNNNEPSHDHPHDHDHTTDQDHTQEHNDLSPDDSAETSSENKQQQARMHRHDHHHHKSSHPHNHHNHPDTTDQSNQSQPTRASIQVADSATLQPSLPTQPSTTMPKRMRKQLKGRAQHGRNKKPNTLEPTSSSTVKDGGNGHEHDYSHEHDHSHDEHMHSHSQAHKGKREIPEDIANPDGSSPPGHFDSMTDQHEECLNLTQLFHHYGLSPDSLISPAQFTYLCPALLYQIDSRVCIRHYHQVDVQEAQPLSGWVWLFSFIAITVISLLSLLGVVLVPILNQSCFKFLLTFLVALAVGTLSGDALLHLLPHSLADHDHSHDLGHGEHSTADEDDWLTKFDGVWKGLTALAGIYLLFVIEHCIRMFKHYKDRGGGFCRSKRRSEDGNIGRKLSDHKLNRHSDAERIHLKRLDDSASHMDTQMTELQPPDSPSKTPLAITVAEYSEENSEESEKKAKKKRHSHSHHGHCHSEKDMQDAGITSIAWMVIMGDGMHNFSDGLAIGAAFSASITGGISTSVAVFCHELPHELGDFAVLLKAGMTVKQAIVYNLLSALMAYFGMVIGTALGQYAHNVTSWIFAVTAGMFLYVALVDMLPEMLHGDSEDQKHCNLGHFVLQNMGMLSGFTIMLLIAIFENQIVVNLGF